MVSAVVVPSPFTGGSGVTLGGSSGGGGFSIAGSIAAAIQRATALTPTAPLLSPTQAPGTVIGTPSPTEVALATPSPGIFIPTPANVTENVLREMQTVADFSEGGFDGSEEPVTARRTTSSRTVSIPGGISIPGTGGGVGFGQFIEGALGVVQNLSQAGVIRGSVGAAFAPPVSPNFGQFAFDDPGLMTRAEQSLGVDLPGGLSCPEMFHITACGNLRPNRLTMVDGTFFAHAGNPTAFSKISIKKRRRCPPKR